MQHAGQAGADCFNGRAHCAARLQAGKVFYPAGRYRGRGVDAHPAPAFEPDFRPGMGVALAHGPHAVHGVKFAALVAGHDAGGNAHIAHQYHECVGNVLAKAFFAVKPESVGRVLAREARCQGIAVVAVAQGVEHGLYLFCGGAVGQFGVVEKALRQLARAWIQPWRQGQIGAQIRGRNGCIGMVVEPAAGLVAQHIGNGAVAGPFHGCHLQSAPACGQGGLLYGNIQRQQPLHVMRLQQHLVAHGVGCGASFGGGLGAGWRVLRLPVGGHSGKAAARPLLPVQPAQHRAAVVHGRARGRFARKPHAKGDAVVLRQLGDIAHGHVVAQAGFGLVVAGQAPQRRKARKQHEQRQHDGRAQQGHAQGGAQGLAQGRVAGGHVRIDQRSEQSQHACQNAHGSEQRLRKQKMAQQRKKAEKEDDESVALGFELQRFERQQQQNQRAACFAPENGAELRSRYANGQHQQADAHPAGGQGFLPHS